ncbi:hypothetical protein H5410_061248, partial [Solanum commersonii]
DHSAQLVGITDALSDPPFGLVHRLSSFAFNIFTFLIIGQYGLSTLELWVRLRLFGDSHNALGDPQAFIYSFSAALFLFLLDSIHALSFNSNA